MAAVLHHIACSLQKKMWPDKDVVTAQENTVNSLKNVLDRERERAVSEGVTKLNEAEVELSKEQAAAKEAEAKLSNELNSEETQAALEELDTEETLAGIDKAIAPLLASEWFPSAICDIAENRWTDIEAEPGKAVIKTTSGTYQAVASIQMERSPETSPI